VAAARIFGRDMQTDESVAWQRLRLGSGCHQEGTSESVSVSLDRPVELRRKMRRVPPAHLSESPQNAKRRQQRAYNERQSQHQQTEK
jgi:hypothetical protein